VLLLACSSSPEPGAPDAGDPGGDAAVSPDADVGPGSEYVFDDDQLRTYELIIAPDDLAWLDANALLEQYVPATLRFEGRDYGPIGVRYKGGFGTLQSCFDAQGNRTCAKISIKLKFNEYDPAGRFYQLKKLNFHSMNADPSKLHDRLAYTLYRQMGVPAPRAVHARLIINGELQGLYALVEQIDGRFTRMNFADGGEGNLYKEVWPVTAATAQPYLDKLQTNEDQNPDVTPMVRFHAALAGASDATIEDVLSQWTDVDMLMSYLAVDRAIDNWDGIVGFWCINGGCGNHNYYWYQDVARDFVWLIPWDMDNTFAEPNPFVAYYGQAPWDDATASCDPVPIFQINGLQVGRRAASCDPLIRWLGTTLRARYLAAGEALLDGPFSDAVVGGELDRWRTQIATAIAEDPTGPSPATWNGSVTTLRQAITGLRADLAATVGR